MKPNKPENRTNRLLRFLFSLLALTLIAAACGSDGESATSGADTEAEATSSSDTDDDTAEATSSDADDTAKEEPADAGDSSDGRTDIRWFVGLGTGTDAPQIERQEIVVEEFNASQDSINLILEIVDFETAQNVLATQIAAGNPPDIIGPVGLQGSNAFAGQYADVEPLIAAAGFDLSPFAGSEEAYRTSAGVLEGVPFATFPNALFYNRALFDEAGLPYPPSEYEEDATSVYGIGTEFEGEWTWEKLQEIAEILSVDANGNDATSADYDLQNIEQFGFVHQWSSNPAGLGTSFGAGSLESADGTAKVPETWRDSWEWYHNLIHNVGAAPNGDQLASELLAADNAFASGNVAMASGFLWYTCCLIDLPAQEEWDLGALPTRDGVLTAKLHGDTFRIHADSPNQQEAFTVLEYFFDEAALQLLEVYGGLPARPDLQDAFFEGQEANYPQGVNWAIMQAGLSYPDSPNHEANMPNFLEANARVTELEAIYLNEADLDFDELVASLEADLNAIWGQ